MVASLYGDFEASAFAAQFQQIFKTTGFETRMGSWGLGSPPGLFAMTKSTNLPPHALQIYQACLDAGLYIKFSTDSRLGDNDLLFVVSGKPAARLMRQLSK
jgi:hypothetical protein